MVIGPHAVFAVETKSRRKPEVGGEASARLHYDGARLRFPGGIVETRPIDQARAQAAWLKRYLAGELGEAVPVVAVLSLPGWYVKRQHRLPWPDVWVSNLKKPKLMLMPWFGPALDEPKRRRIAHAIMRRYPQAGTAAS